MAEPERRCDRHPALFLVAQELCSTDLTDGFCTPRNKNACACWDRAGTLLHESGFSAQALVWILKNRPRIEKEAAGSAVPCGVPVDAVAALKLRAQRGLDSAERTEVRDFWRGYAKALADLESGTGAKLAAKDAAGVPVARTFTDEELTAIYKRANGEDVGKAQPLTTQRIFRAMRAMVSASCAPIAATNCTYPDCGCPLGKPKCAAGVPELPKASEQTSNKPVTDQGKSHE